MRIRALICMMFFTITANADDWPKFGGLSADFSSKEKGLRTDWQTSEPKALWKFKVGIGFSSVVESNGYAYTQGYSDGKNTLFCLESKNGNLVWKKSYPCSIGDNYFKGGSRSTPLIYNENLFLLAHNGDFYSMDAVSGEINWSLNVIKDLGGIRPTWGYASTPLIYKDSIILNTGADEGSIVALDLSNGKVLWRSGKFSAAYSSISKKHNEDIFLLFHSDGLSLHSLSDGREKAYYQHKTRYGINACQPVLLNDRILLSSGYGKGSALVDFSSSKPKAIWKTNKVASQMSTPVLWEGYFYGINGQAGARSKFSTLFCISSSNGRVMWEEKGFGLGTVILVNDTLVVLSDEGELALIEANAEKYSELARFQVLAGKENWIPPTYSNGRLHCRSSDGDWVCLAMSSN